MGKWDKHEKQKKLDDQDNGRLNIVEVDNDEYKKLLDGIKEVKTVKIDWDEVAAKREAIKRSRQPADISEMTFNFGQNGVVDTDTEYRLIEVEKHDELVAALEDKRLAKETKILERVEQEAAAFKEIKAMYNDPLFWDEVDGKTQFNYCRFGSHLYKSGVLADGTESD